MGRRIYPPVVVGRNLTLEDLRGMGGRNYRAAPESQALSIRITGEHLSAWKQLRAELPEMNQTWIVENAILALAANVLKDTEGNRQKISLQAHKERRGTGSRKYHTPPESKALSVRITGEHLSAWKQLCVALPGISPSVILRNAILALAANVFKDEKKQSSNEQTSLSDAGGATFP